MDEASTHDDDDSRVENYFELEYKHSQKELLKAKSKLYEYRYKIDALKKKLIEIDQQR